MHCDIFYLIKANVHSNMNVTAYLEEDEVQLKSTRGQQQSQSALRAALFSADEQCRLSDVVFIDKYLFFFNLSLNLCGQITLSVMEITW